MVQVVHIFSYICSRGVASQHSLTNSTPTDRLYTLYIYYIYFLVIININL